jgi:hypothetical protein
VELGTLSHRRREVVQKDVDRGTREDKLNEAPAKPICKVSDLKSWYTRYGCDEQGSVG